MKYLEFSEKLITFVSDKRMKRLLSESDSQICNLKDENSNLK